MANFFNSYAAEIFALINSILVIVILPMIGAWLRQHLQEKRGARVEKAIASGLQAAISAATAGKGGRETIRAVMLDESIRQEVIGLAQDYVQETVPQTLTKLDIEPALAKIIAARVDDAVAKLAQNYMIANKAIAEVSDTEMHLGSRSTL